MPFISRAHQWSRAFCPGIHKWTRPLPKPSFTELDLTLLQLLGRDSGVVCNLCTAPQWPQVQPSILGVKCLGEGCHGFQSTQPLSYFLFFRVRVSPSSSDSLPMFLSVPRLTTFNFTQRLHSSLSSQVQQAALQLGQSAWIWGSHLCQSLSRSGHRGRMGVSSSLLRNQGVNSSKQVNTCPLSIHPFSNHTS